MQVIHETINWLPQSAFPQTTGYDCCHMWTKSKSDMYMIKDEKGKLEIF